MLNQTRTRKEFEKFKEDDYQINIIERINKLPQKLKLTAAAFNVKKPEGSNSTEGKIIYYNQVKAVEDLESFTPEERKQIFRVFAPKLADYVEALWQKQEQMPYDFCVWFRTRNSRVNAAYRRHMLNRIRKSIAPYNQDIVWFSEWASFIDDTGLLLGIAIDRNDDDGKKVRENLMQAAREKRSKDLRIKYIPEALLSSSDPECWQVVSDLLVSDQKDSDLRSAVRTSMETAHPDAFKLMCKTIRDNNLFKHDNIAMFIKYQISKDETVWNKINLAASLDLIIKYLDDEKSVQNAIQSETGENLYFALWATAFYDSEKALEEIAKLLKDKDPQRRYPAVHILPNIKSDLTLEYLVEMLMDEDMRIVSSAIKYPVKQYTTNYLYWDTPEITAKHAEVFEKLPERFPLKKTTLPSITWDWNKLTADPDDVFQLLIKIVRDEAPEKLIPYLKRMTPHRRSFAAVKLGLKAHTNSEILDALLKLAADPAEEVRSQAFSFIYKLDTDKKIVSFAEKLLTRKTEDIRRSAMCIILNQENQFVLQSIDKLLDSKDVMQKTGGMELLEEMIKTNREAEICKKKAEEYK
jgi:HEAT repeat protein